MVSGSRKGLTYCGSGVDVQAAATGLAELVGWVGRSMELRRGVGQPLLPIGFFAGAVRLTERLALVVCTDGVGSKAVVAQLMGKFDTIGIDCVAVNVNDILCTGAEPLALVDYVSVQEPSPELLAALGQGLYEGARRANVVIVGGELSQHPDTLVGPRKGYAFDLVGTAVGLLEDRKPVVGRDVRPGDVVLGLPSDGIHCIGLSLARRALLKGRRKGVDRYLAECGRSVGEELLLPTHIYVPEVMALLRAGVEVKGLVHISGDGLLNLTRLEADVGYRITSLPPIPSVLRVVQAEGQIETAEMFGVFNMGVGFCAVVGPDEVDSAVRAIGAAGGSAQAIGEVVKGPERRVLVDAFRLEGRDGRFRERAL